MKRNAHRVNNPARLARLRDQAIKLRERVNRSTLAFHERSQARLTWLQRAFRGPMVADWAIFTQAKTLLSAFMALLGLASGKKSSIVALMVASQSPQASRIQPRTSDVRRSPRPEIRNTNRNGRRLYAEGLEQRQMMATDVYVDDSFTAILGQPIADADLGTTGNQPAIFGVTAFTTINAALAAVTPSGTITVNGGTYAETVSLTGTRTMKITGPNSAQSVIIDDLTTIAGTTVVIEGSSNLTVGDADSRTLAGVISGSGSFTKQGAGTYTLAASNLYTGATNINTGTLRIAGALSAPAGAAGIYTFDSVSGATINNAGSAGVGKNGSLVAGSAVVGGGRFGNAMSTSGAGARMSIADAGISLSGGNWTAAAWFNNLFTDGDWNTLFVDSFVSDAQLIIQNGTNNLGTYVNGSFRDSGFDLVPAANSGWNHVAAVGSGTTTTFYRNGVQVGAANGKSGTNITSVGASPAGGGMQRFAQLIDDVYIYQSALNAAEILTLYNSGPVTASNSIPDSSTVTIASGAFLDLNGSSETIGTLAGTGTVTSGIAGSPTLTVGSGNGSGNFSGVIQNGAGTVNLAKTGTGTLTLSGFNSYSGATTVSAGTLAVSGFNSDGVIQNSSVTIDAGATFLYSGNNLVGNSVPFTVNGTLNMNGFSDAIGNISGSGTIINNSTNTFEGLSFDKLDSAYTFSGNISGTGRLALRGVLASLGSLTLSGGTYALSRIDVVNGTLNLNGTVTTTSDVIVGSTRGFSLPTTGSAAVNVQGGTLSIGGLLRLGAASINGTFTQSTGTVSASGIDMNTGSGGTGTGTVTLSGGTFVVGGSGMFATDSTGTKSLNIGLATVRASAPFSASIAATITSAPTIDTNGFNVAWSGAISGSGNLTKIGNGTLTVSAANTYTGTTSANAGTLSVTGSTAAGNVITANSGGTLAGTGTINGTATIASGGTLSPGLSPGVLSTGILSVSGGYIVEFAGNSGAGAANGHDQTNVTGTVTLGGASTLLLNFAGLTAVELSANPTFVFINNDGSDAVDGTFNGLAEGSLVASNVAGSGKSLVISYVGGNGNDVALLTVPPPSIASNSAAVSANEGSTAYNTGTFSGALGNNTVTVTASIGTVTKNDTLGTWDWSLNAADGPAGPFTATITATDNQNAVANTTFTYAFNNVPPTIALSGNATVDEGSLYTLNLGAISDPGTDTVTAYSINWGDGPAENFIGNPANTTATHTYADGPNGYTTTVTLTDEDGTFTGGSLSVIVLNVAPTAADDAIAWLENDSAQVVNVLANDSDPAGVNDPLIVTSVNIMGATGTATLEAGVVSYSPDGFFEALGAGETTLDTFEYSISDGDGGTDTATVTVTITGQNDAPTATGTLPNVSVNQNAANSVISLTGLFGDVDANDTLSITAVSSSNGMVTAGVSGSSLTLDYQANQSGTATITVTATDGSGASVSLTFNVVVVSPAQLGNDIILLIQQWKTDGKINAGVANSMIVKVENALKSYDKGNITAAGNQLNALKNEISAKVKPGALTLADATLAISLIDDLIDSMTA